VEKRLNGVMFESPVKQSLSSPILATMFLFQTAPDDRRLIIYSVLLVLIRRRDLSRSANAISAGNRKFSLPFCQLAPSLEVTPFEFVHKLH